MGATGWVGVGSLWFGWHGGAPLGAKTPLVWVGVGFPQVLGVSLGWRALGGTLGCWGSLWLDEHWDLLGRALGCTFGCRDSRGADGRWVPSQAGGPYGSEGFGGHPCCWCPRGWVGAPMGAGGPYGWMRTGISLGGRWAAPLGARTHVEQVGIGCPRVLGVPMGQKALGRTLGRVLGFTHGCQGGWALGCTFGYQGRPWGGWALGTRGCWGSPWVGGLWDLLGRALGCTFGCRDSRGAGRHWVPSGAGAAYGSEGFGAHPCGQHPMGEVWGHPWVLGVLKAG